MDLVLCVHCGRKGLDVVFCHACGNMQDIRAPPASPPPLVVSDLRVAWGKRPFLGVGFTGRKREEGPSRGLEQAVILAQFLGALPSSPNPWWVNFSLIMVPESQPRLTLRADQCPGAP